MLVSPKSVPESPNLVAHSTYEVGYNPSYRLDK